MEKFLSVILSLIIALGACLSAPLTIKSNAATVDDLTFTLNEDGQSYSVSACSTSATGELVIPATYNDLPVTKIGDNAFKDCSSLTSVTIPEGVMSIGDSAFYNCKKLISVTIPNSITSIGYNVFENCSDAIVFIVDENEYAIEYFEENNLDYTSYDQSLLVFELNEDGQSYSVSRCSIYLSGELVIPSTYNNLPVTAIGLGAFAEKPITSVVIPDSVTSIEYGAFYFCTSLTSITIPDSVTHIGGDAFFYTACYQDSNNWENDVLYIDNHLITAKSSVSGDYTIKEGTKCVAEYAFVNCRNITSISIPNSVAGIGSDAFCNCTSLTSVNITNLDSWYNIDFGLENANPLCYAKNLYLNGDLVTELVVPEGVTEIKKYAFYNCTSLTSVTIPDSVTSIGEKAFYNCTNLENVFAKDLNSWSVIDFADLYANPMSSATNLYLNGENLTNLIIPEGLTEIKKYTFYNCSTLESVTIPESVTSIGDSAFAKCVQLKKVNISDIEKWCNITFASSTANPLSNSAGLYLDDKIIRNVILPETLTEVKAYTFTGNRFLKSVKLPDTIEKIGTSAFCNCINLELLVLSENLTDIGGSAFKGCKALESVVIPKSLKNVGYGAFHPNDGLKCVFYEGSVSDWNNIVMDEDNFTTSDLVIHYNSTDHTYMEVVNEPIFEGVEGTREEVCKICGHVGKEEKIEFINSYLAGVTEFDVALDAPTNYLVANISASKDLNESIVVVDGYTLNTTPNSDYGYYGTGSKVQVLDDNGTQVAEYTLVVRGDVNGDSVCDVLDCMLIELARNNHKELNGIYLNAGDLTENGSIDVYDFEAVVNKAIA